MGSLEGFTTQALEEELQRRQTPARITFDAYLHGGYSASEWMEVIEDQTGFAISRTLASRIRDSLEEVKLDCTLDTETEKLYINSVKT
jgi:hypothetical protein